VTFEAILHEYVVYINLKKKIQQQEKKKNKKNNKNKNNKTKQNKSKESRKGDSWLTSGQYSYFHLGKGPRCFIFAVIHHIDNSLD